MPNQPITEQLKTLLQLEPGDLIISEAHYEGVKQSNLKAVNSKNLKSFKASHISIYTGDFIKPFAHSVQEGYKLPGVRLTKAWDGKHVVLRFNDKELSQRIAKVARIWALSETMYDFDKFDSVYPARHWADQYYTYKKQFFSIPNAIVNGPATPYDAARASKQLCDGMRNPKNKTFNNQSLRRAIKFATRSDYFGTISKGLRCTSFAVAAVQAATLSPIVKVCATKFSFKDFRRLNEQTFLALSRIFFKENWEASELGMTLNNASSIEEIAKVFPEGFQIDLKYAIPADVFKELLASSQWETVGSYVILDDKLEFCNDSSLDVSLIQKPKTTSPKTKNPTVKHGINHMRRSALLFTLQSFNEEQKNLAAQLQQEKTIANSLDKLGASPIRNATGSPRFSEKVYNGKTLKFDLR